MEPTSSTGIGPSLLAILAVLCLAVGLASGSTPASLASAIRDASFEYDYNASYNLSGQTGMLSADLSLDHGTPTLHFTDGEHVLTLQDGQLALSAGSGPAELILPPSAWDAAGEILQYLGDGGLQRDMEALKPFFSDLLRYNAFTLTADAVPRPADLGPGAAETVMRYTLDTTPVRLVGALQRWLVIRGTDPQLKAALNEMEIMRLPFVQNALEDARIDLGAAAARALLSAAKSLSAPIVQIPSDGDQNALLPIHLEGIRNGDVWESGLLTVGNPEKKDRDIWAELRFSAEGPEADSADLTMRYQGETYVTAHADWICQDRIRIDGSWAFPTSGSQYAGGDFCLACSRTETIPRLELSLSVYGESSSPTLALSCADRQLSFLYIQNTSVSPLDGLYCDDATEGYLSAQADQPSFVRGALSWDDSTYSVYLRSNLFEFQGQGDFERTGDGFHQKGDFHLALQSREASSYFDVHLEQTLTIGPRSFRMTQHLDACPSGVPVPLLTYDDRHALSIR